MKKAFTMIELIFVIAIIGILAMFAIPKLNMTKSEAKGTTIAHQLTVCINEAGNNYMKEGTFGGKTQPGSDQSFSCKSASRCFDFEENDNNGSLKVVKKAGTTSPECEEAQSIADKNLLATTHIINF